MDRYVLVTQGEVFYVTEMLAQLEGLQRGLTRLDNRLFYRGLRIQDGCII